MPCATGPKQGTRVPAPYRRALSRPSIAPGIHGRRANESGHEHVCGLVIDLERPRRLLDHPILHDDNGIAHRHRFRLVVRDIDRRGSHRDASSPESCAPRYAIWRRGWKAVRPSEKRPDAEPSPEQARPAGAVLRKGLWVAGRGKYRCAAGRRRYGPECQFRFFQRPRIFMPKAMLSNTLICGKSA